MAVEQLWSDEIIDRVAKLCGDRSIPYGYAIGQRKDLVDLLRAAAAERLEVTGSPTDIYAALCSDTNPDVFDLDKARIFWENLNWGLTVEKFTGELLIRLLEFTDLFRCIPPEIQSTEERLGLHTGGATSPVDTY